MEWHAKWIWGKGDPSPRNEWRFFRKRFQCPSNTWNKAMVQLTADSRYILYVNGHRVGRGPNRTWVFEQSYDEYDVSRFLHRDRSNVISVLVLHFGVSTFSSPYGRDNRAGLLFQCNWMDGEEVVDYLVSDSTWDTARCTAQNSRSPRLALQLGFAEMIDARLWPDDWHTNTSMKWDTSVELGSVGMEPWTTLIPRDIPMLTEETMYPKAIRSLKSVQPVAFTCTLDLRNQMDPESVYHANVIQYIGYVATVLRLSQPGEVEIGFPNGSLTVRRVMIGGTSCSVEDMSGELPQRFWTIHLPAGNHLLMLDVAGFDHGRNPQLSIDSDVSFDLVSPLHNNNDNPFISVGPFDLIEHVDTISGERAFQENHPDYIALALCKTAEELKNYQRWIRPFDSHFVSPLSVFSLSVWKKNITSFPVPQTMQCLAVANQSPAVVPLYPGADTEFVVDFGRELSGFIQFELDAAEGTIIDCYGYEYQKDGWRQDTFDLENTLRYVCREGYQTYQSPTRRGLRYLMVTVRNASRSPEIFGIQMVQSNYPVAEVGQFACSDIMLNEIYEISRHTTRLCMEDTFVDCPAYEQAFWVGDSRNESLVNYYVFGEQDIVKRCLRLVPRSRHQTPLYSDQVPSGWVSVIPNWTFLWAIACEEYYQRTADVEFAQEMLPHICYTLDHYCRYIDSTDLLNIKAWNLLDWAPMDQPNEGIVSHQNMFLVKTLRSISRLARSLDREDLVEKYEVVAAKLTDAINKELWSEERCAYIDSIHTNGVRSSTLSMQTQVTAYLCDVVPEDRKHWIEEYLLTPPNDFVPIGSPFMSFFYYEALTKYGSVNRIVDDIRTNFGAMVEAGATTCWEMYPNFEENRANKNFLTRSHCHAWSSAPGYFLPRQLLGVEGTGLGWKKVVVRPNPCGLKWAKGTVPLPDAGQIDVSWSISEDNMNLNIWAPPTVQVQAELPDGMTGTINVHGHDYSEVY